MKSLEKFPQNNDKEEKSNDNQAETSKESQESKDGYKSEYPVKEIDPRTGELKAFRSKKEYREWKEDQRDAA